jgi:hypothetical protein
MKRGYNIIMKQGRISFKYLHKTRDFLHESTDTLITKDDLNSGSYSNFEELMENIGKPPSKELFMGMQLFTKYQLSDDTILTMSYDLD